MPIVVGVRFKDSGKLYQFDPRDVPLVVGDWAIVDTVRGPELGRIGAPPTAVPEEEIIGELKPVLRRATQSDMDRLAHYQQYVDDALAICAEKVALHRLPMVLVKAEYNFDGSRLTFFFTAEKRVDFRALVRDLARAFHTRIELRQIGPRDEAKLLGGIGPCGRLLCCSTFLPDFARVSIKMAKDQDLPLNPTKISGVCGRLLCCLSYEHEQYLDIKSELPARGAWVQTPEGPGEVVAVNVVRETVTVELTTGATIDCTAQQIGQVTAAVAAEARSRNTEGITPVARRIHEIDNAEGSPSDVALLALEDRAPAPPVRLEAAVAPTVERNRQRPPRPHTTAADAQRSGPERPAEQTRVRPPRGSEESSVEQDRPARGGQSARPLPAPPQKGGTQQRESKSSKTPTTKDQPSTGKRNNPPASRAAAPGPPTQTGTASDTAHTKGNDERARRRRRRSDGK